MCYFDDEFLTKCLEEYPIGIELMLRIIMNDNTLVVKEVQVQSVIKNLQGRSIRMDVKTIDLEKKQYDVEMQKADSGAKPKRARYNSSLMDANAILPGDDTELLPETYVIFITENDVLEGNLPIYHIDRTIKENGKLFDDKAHIIYVNGEVKDDTPLGRLMQDLSCTDPDEMNYKELADRARYFKKDKEGRQIMSKIMDEIINYEKIEVAERMLNDGEISVDKIAKYLELPVEVVKELADNLQLV
ncbi:MAG: Rpn family recombination-promoting nuclease/putative transposase [Lachnospiraceae bacterium]|nr:Rpn family recombination-promoting nuclease/putative transposase [Lachnospiraceae bacterium]